MQRYDIRSIWTSIICINKFHLCLVRITHSTMIPNTGLRLNVTATVVNTFLIFLFGTCELNTFVVRAYRLKVKCWRLF